MTEKPTVSFNIMADTQVPVGYIKALRNGIKFVFDSYFTNTEYQLPKSISTHNQMRKRPTEKMSYETFFSEYFKDYILPYNEFHIILTKHVIEYIAAHAVITKPIISNLELTLKSHFLITLPISEYKNFINPTAAFEDCVRHEILHSHYRFNFKNVFYTNNDFFSENHCRDTNCLMAPSKIYEELTKPYDLCDRCKEKIKIFNKSDEILKTNIMNSVVHKTDANVNSIIQLYDKICPSH